MGTFEYFLFCNSRAVQRACSNLLPPDKNTSDAVDVRQVLDLRIGEQKINNNPF